jgi:hypothetical protein
VPGANKETEKWKKKKREEEKERKKEKSEIGRGPFRSIDVQQSPPFPKNRESGPVGHIIR